MKLRNKKTGIIGELHFEPDKEYHFTVATEDPADMMIYKTLAGLYVEWEDYEENEYYYAITSIKADDGITKMKNKHNDMTAFDKSIGNCFETREEAEKAVEKLKAWKRLKDKGFRFVGVRGIGKVIDFDVPKPYHHVAFDEYNANEDELEFYNDLMFLFGGEDE